MLSVLTINAYVFLCTCEIAVDQLVILDTNVLIHILVRLDVENLIRCKSVCKSWKSLISDRHFIKAHQDHCFNNNDNGQAMIDQVILRFYYGRVGQKYQIVGSSNGLVCINSSHGNEFSVANPWTREERMAQKHLASNESCWGFGYDPVINDYKIVFGVKEACMYRTSFQVLSLKSNVWKHIGHVNGICPHGELATLCNGALHWLMHHEGQENSSIISFDLSKEVFKEIPQPDDARYNPNKEDIPSLYMMVGIKDECLCIWRNDLYEHPDTWIMRKYIVKESWEPLVSNCQKKDECIRHPDIDYPDIERLTHDTWFLKKCMCDVPTATIIQSLISPHSSGQKIRRFDKYAEGGGVKSSSLSKSEGGGEGVEIRSPGTGAVFAYEDFS
ncbi:F-box protein CPR1-like protein [Tanacetum coccineum]